MYPARKLQSSRSSSDYDYDYIMAPQRGRPYGANLGSMGRNTGTWSIRSECLSNITSWSRRKGIENTTLPFIRRYNGVCRVCRTQDFMYPGASLSTYLLDIHSLHICRENLPLLSAKLWLALLCLSRFGYNWEPILHVLLIKLLGAGCSSCSV